MSVEISSAACLAVLSLVVGSGPHRQPSAADAVPYIELTKDTFERLVLKQEGPVFIWFIAPNCPPCAEMDKDLRKVMPRYAKQVLFLRVDGVRESDLVTANKVTVVPTSFLIKIPEGVGTFAEGQLTEENLVKFINEGLAMKPAPPDPKLPPPVKRMAATPYQLPATPAKGLTPGRTVPLRPPR